MDDVKSFCDFLTAKGLPSRVVDVIKDQKITQSVMGTMEESDLEVIFPAMGDRLQFRPILKMFKVSSPSVRPYDYHCII